MGEGTAVLKGGRLASEDRFQYHEWTFKQACISSLLQLSRQLFYNITLTAFLCSLLSLRRLWLGCFPFRPLIRIFSSSLLLGKTVVRNYVQFLTY